MSKFEKKCALVRAEADVMLSGIFVLPQDLNNMKVFLPLYRKPNILYGVNGIFAVKYENNSMSSVADK